MVTITSLATGLKRITRKSPFTGKINSMDIVATDEQIEQYVNSSRTIQSIFPALTLDEREFLMTGVTPEEFDEMAIEDEDA